jgi:hypothetical protein
LLVPVKEIGLEVTADKTKYTVMSRDYNAGRSHDIKINNNSFEIVETFKYLGTTLTNKNSVQGEFKSRLKSGDACYHSVQNLLSSSLLSLNLKVKVCRTIILPVVWYECETWSLEFRDEESLTLLENMALKKTFGPNSCEVTGDWRKLRNEEFHDLYSSSNLRVFKSRRMRWVVHVARME